MPPSRERSRPLRIGIFSIEGDWLRIGEVAFRGTICRAKEFDYVVNSDRGGVLIASILKLMYQRGFGFPISVAVLDHQAHSQALILEHQPLFPHSRIYFICIVRSGLRPVRSKCFCF